MNSDLVSLIVENKNEIVKLQRVVGGEAPVTTNLDMGGYRILNVAHPRDPRKKKDFESDLVTAKTLNDYTDIVEQNYMGKDKDGSLDGRLDMSNHRISGLADPTDADDAVTRRHIASRFQALSDEVQGNKRKLDALQNLFEVENNQVLIRVYELLDADFESIRVVYGERRVRFTKHPLQSDDIHEFGFIDIFTLKEYFIHLLEKPVDDVTWLRIKQPGTYTIHFDLILSGYSYSFFFFFSFELHTRDEIIHFSNHNPKHDINLEKGENCLLVLKIPPQIIRAGSKIYIYYNT